jgi:hypothetical protein
MVYELTRWNGFGDVSNVAFIEGAAIACSKKPSEVW